MQYVSAQHQVVAFDGPDALAFLQSQLTNDVAALAIGAWQWQGYCNAKGRLHATFALVRSDDNRFLAIVHQSTAAFLVKRLTMFRLRSKLTIEVEKNVSVQHHFSPPSTERDTLATLSLGHGRWVTIETLDQLQHTSALPNEVSRWEAIGVEAMQPEILAETNEKFVPQMLGWDVVAPGGGVSFSKGCYPGQEVVARAHYRGAVKRELVRVTLPEMPACAPGAEIERSDGSVIEIVNAVRAPAGWLALAVAPIALATAL